MLVAVRSFKTKRRLPPQDGDVVFDCLCYEVDPPWWEVLVLRQHVMHYLRRYIEGGLLVPFEVAEHAKLTCRVRRMTTYLASGGEGKGVVGIAHVIREGGEGLTVAP